MAETVTAEIWSRRVAAKLRLPVFGICFVWALVGVAGAIGQPFTLGAPEPLASVVYAASRFWFLSVPLALALGWESYR